MLKYSRVRGTFPRRTFWIVTLALVCAGAVAVAQQPEAVQWQRVSSDNPAFSLEIPADWHVREVEGRGARLLPPDGGPVVEVVAWTALHPPATPDKAAIEHEGVLGRAVDYRRDGIEQFETDEGAPGLAVTGRVRSRGITESSFFAAYSSGPTHYVLGTFASQERLARLRDDVLDRMTRSFSAEPGAAPVTRPPRPLPEPEPVEPDTDLEPDPPEPEPEPEPAPQPPPESEPESEPEVAPAPGQAPPSLDVGGDTRPVGPEVREPRTPWIEHLSPAGFSVSMPMDWEVATEGGLIAITPAVEGAGEGLALIWPVTGSDPGAEAALRLALSRRDGLRLLRVTSVEETGGAMLIEGRLSGDRRLVATWAHDGAFGLLRAAIAPGSGWESALPDLARMAASFRPGQWPVSYRPRVEMAGDLGLLRWELPTGWQVRGGARETDGEITIDVEALGPTEDALRVGWQQPMRPHFRALTPLLESLGWREGERYSVPENGGGGLLIYRRREPEQLVREMLLPRHPRELRLTDIDSLPPSGAVADLLSQPDSTGQVVTLKGGSAIGPRERLYLAATARAEPPLSTTAWDAAVLRADAGEGRLPVAVEALLMMVRSATVTERASEEQAERLQTLIDRATRAVGAVPAEMQPEPDTGLTGVVGADVPVTAEATWQMPEGAGEYWSTQADEDGRADVLGRPGRSAPTERL